MCYGKSLRQKASQMPQEDFKPSAPPLEDDFQDTTAVDNPAQMTESTNGSALEAQRRVTFSLEASHPGEEAQIQGASPLEQLLRDCSYEHVRNMVLFFLFFEV